jgi:hypothetical protein
LTEESEKEKQQEEEQTEEHLPEPEQAPTRPPQVVEIKTPLDKPEFDWFIETFMQKMGLTDRKQSAIMLTNMMYDMGLDPYSDLKDLQGAMEEMNNMLKNLPDTPTAMKVKDTVGGMFAAKAGRTLLQNFPRVGTHDPMYDRMEKIMDKYMPMIMAMRMVGDMMRTEPTQQKSQTATELPEAVKAEITDLKQSVTNITELLSKQRANEEQKAFAESVVQSVLTNVAPRLQNLEAQVESLLKQPPPVVGSERTDELREIKEALKEAVDKMGEKAGQKNLTLADVDPILNIIERLEAKSKKEPAGEFDWKTATVSGITEMGKEAITAYKEVEAAKTTTLGSQARAPPPPNTEMQTIIKKQVQNYITQRLQTGATTMNIQEAAQALGLTPEQVSWAYQTLMAEGWINVRTPEQKPKGASENTPQEKGQPAADQPFIET